ncbi:hypothetical protein Tco_1531896 [Tanacetum coccineum]
MDKLSKRKFVIVCHEKVVRIPLEGDEILRVHGERTQGVVKTLMNTKVATPVAKSPYRLAPSEMQELSEQLQELQDEVERESETKTSKGMSITIQSDVKDKILATPSETSKVENGPAEMLRDLDQQMEKRADDGCTLWIKLYSKYEYGIRYHPGRANVVIDALRRKERVKPRRVRTMAMTIYIRCAPFEALYGRKCRSHVIWAEIGGSSLIGPELVQEKTNKAQTLEFEVGDQVMLKVSPWKGVIRFGKKGKLAPRYVGPFEILKRIGPVAYRLRLPEELSGVHDTFHAKLLAVRYLVKVRWNSKRGPKFTWECEDHMKSKYPWLFVDRAVESAS